jgi:hypothetical protein
VRAMMVEKMVRGVGAPPEVSISFFLSSSSFVREDSRILMGLTL